MPRFIFLKGFCFEAWIGSAHELQWNFLPANRRAEISAAPSLPGPSIRAETDEVKEKNSRAFFLPENLFGQI
jgi:hypothetical protein